MEHPGEEFQPWPGELDRVAFREDQGLEATTVVEHLELLVRGTQIGVVAPHVPDMDIGVQQQAQGLCKRSQLRSAMRCRDEHHRRDAIEHRPEMRLPVGGATHGLLDDEASHAVAYEHPRAASQLTLHRERVEHGHRLVGNPHRTIGPARQRRVIPQAPRMAVRILAQPLRPQRRVVRRVVHPRFARMPTQPMQEDEMWPVRSARRVHPMQFGHAMPSLPTCRRSAFGVSLF